MESGRPLYFCPVVSSFFLLLISIFFPCLISAITDWMSIILPHVAFVRIYDAGLKRAARGSLIIKDAKVCKKSPKIPHRGTTAQLCRATFATKALIDNRKKTC